MLSTPVHTARQSWSVTWAAEAPARTGFTAPPVVVEPEQVVGILTGGDPVVDPVGGGRGRPTTVGG